MSQYSQLVTSFERTGDYPLEANYIFSTEESLKEFYSDPINQATLYKGLLKVVEKDESGKQSLWWVVSKDDSEELEFKRLLTFTSMEDLQAQLNELTDTLEKEIAERKKEDLVFATKLEELLKQLQELQATTGDLGDKIKAVVGTDSDDIISYLKTLPYNNLTQVAIALHKFLETVDSENPEIQTLPEIQKFLAGFKDTDNLHIVLEKLYNKIMGDPTPDENFNTFRDLENAIKNVADKAKQKTKELQQELDNTQRGVGLEPNGNFSPDAYTYYLKESTSVMNALRTLDALLYKTITTTNIDPKDTETIDMSIENYADRTAVSGQVKIASKSGNQITIESDGIYHSVDLAYNNGRLDLLINGYIVKQYDLGLSGLVSTGRYDSATEEIVIELNTPDGSHEVRIPAHDLIEEWEILNKESDAVVLTKTRSIAGKDTLSADVKVAVGNKNILQKNDAGQLYVKGTADNIRMNSGTTVESAIANINSNLQDYQQDINSARDAVTAETNRAKEAETKLEQSIKNCETNCNSKVQELEGTISQNKLELQNSITEESNRAQAAEQALKTQLDNNDSKTKAVQDGLVEVNQKVTDEITKLQLADQSLQNGLDNANSNIQTNSSNIETIKSDLQALKDSEHSYVGTNTIKFNKEGNVVSADLKIAGGTNIIKADDGSQGVYASVDIGYDPVSNKIWLITSGGNTKEVQLSEGNIIEDIYYETNDKSLVFVFNANGVQKTTKFPVADLFNDWIVVNPAEGSAIELTKTNNVKDPSTADTPDTLSARLLIAQVESNAAQIVGNGLFVSNKETKENSAAIEDLKSKQTEFETKQGEFESDLKEEISRAKSKESELEAKIELAQKSATTTVAAGQNDNTAEHLTVTESEDSDHKIFTIQLNDVASAEALTAETSRATDAEKVLTDNLANEVNERVKGDEALQKSIDDLNTKIDSSSAAATTTVVKSESDITKKHLDITEGTRDGHKEFTVELLDIAGAEDLTVEAADRAKGDKTLQDNIDAEAQARESKDNELEGAITEETNRAKAKEAELESAIKLAQTKAKSSVVASESDNTRKHLTVNKTEDADESDKFTLELTDVASEAALNSEIERAVSKDAELNTTLQQQILKTEALQSSLSELDSYTKEELKKKLENVQLNTVNELQYQLIVDGQIIGTIDIPKDQFLQSVELVENTLVFTFITTTGTTVTSISLTEILQKAVEKVTGDVANLQTVLTKTAEDLASEISRAKEVETKLQNDVTNLTAQVTTNTADIAQNKSGIQTLKESVHNEEDRAKSEEHRIEDLITAQNSKIDSLSEKVTGQDSKISDLDSTVKAMKNSVDNAENLAQEAKNIATELKGTVTSLQSQLEKEISDRTTGEKAIKEDIQNMKKEIEESINQKLQDLITRVTALETALTWNNH